ncbi:hypothetical protein B0H17DRAFT_1193451 [Mycena rosella]|uniref:Uncharacterized protein n=1 Tax=Mycena rosella TaxID=1033263 RepID=A0AAD7M7S9_MYCRO|nr:hypothetical protein B0H17DRAFT_1193451 [Mycena rosella]
MKRIQAKVARALRRLSGVPAPAILPSSPPPLAREVITGEPILPPELEREIFELAAASDAPPDYWMHQHVGDTVLVLPQVCRRAQSWIEPFIYERVSLLQNFRGEDPIPQFLATLDVRPATFFATHVKHLYLAPTIPLAVAQRVLRACTGVVSFGCHHPYALLAPLLAPLPLQRLLVSALAFPAAPAPADLPPWSASLTHLGLSLALPTPALAHLPALTHLAVDYAALPDAEIPGTGVGAALAALLGAGPRIRCLVLVTAAKTDYRWALQRLREDAFADARLCLHLRPVMDGAWDEWSRRVPDMFAEAERRRA